MVGARLSGEAAIVERTTPADLRRAAAEVLFGRPWSNGPEGDMTPAQVERIRDLNALAMHEMHEHSIRQIAVIVRESKATVERRLKRARARMLSETGLDLT